MSVIEEAMHSFYHAPSRNIQDLTKSTESLSLTPSPSGPSDRTHKGFEKIIPIIGLHNLGNTCFYNSTLQVRQVTLSFDLNLTVSVGFITYCSVI